MVNKNLRADALLPAIHAGIEQLIEVSRPANEKALAGIATHLAQHIERLLVFDTLGDNSLPERVSQPDRTFDDLSFAVAGRNARYEVLINL